MKNRDTIISMDAQHNPGHLGNVADLKAVGEYGMSLLPGNIYVLDPMETGACVPACLCGNVKLQFRRDIETVIAPCVVQVIAGRRPTRTDAWLETEPNKWLLKTSDTFLSENLRAGLSFDALHTGGAPSMHPRLHAARLPGVGTLSSVAGHFVFQMPPASEPMTERNKKKRTRPTSLDSD